MSTIATDSVQASCRPYSGNSSTETSNSTLGRPALGGMCCDADGPSVEAAKRAVSNLKAPELKPGRRQAHHGGILVPGGRRWEPARVAVAGETRRSAGVGDVRCRPDSRGTGGPDKLPHGNDGDPLRTSMIVPAMYVIQAGQARQCRRSCSLMRRRRISNHRGLDQQRHGSSPIVPNRGPRAAW